MVKITLALVADPGFSRLGPPTPKVGSPTYYLANFPLKTARNWKKLGREEEVSLGSTNEAVECTAAPNYACIVIITHSKYKLKSLFEFIAVNWRESHKLWIRIPRCFALDNLVLWKRKQNLPESVKIYENLIYFVSAESLKKSR